VHTYLRDLSDPVNDGILDQSRQSVVRGENWAEVGLPHSSDETGESRWSEGGNKEAISRAETRGGLETQIHVKRKPTGIRYLASKYQRLEGLMNRVNEGSLVEMHRRQDGKKAVGVDGVNKSEYGKNLGKNVADLIKRMKTCRYYPQPVRRAYIPKADGKTRPLGIPSYEDRLVQGVMAGVLNSLYETRFLDCSYGFRPNRSAHHAVRYINQTLMNGGVNYIIDADIKGFFDNVNHGWMMKFLRHDIADEKFLRYIKRFLAAGVMEGTERQETDKGTPQGGLISPVLANVYLHYVLDLWCTKPLRKRCRGQVYYVRYADDFLLMFQRERDAKQALTELRERLGMFGLELAENKTRIVPFGRLKGTKMDFDFLGFTFFNARTRKGNYQVGVRTSEKKLKAKRREIKEWMWTRLKEPVGKTLESIQLTLTGHANYYGVNGNIRKIRGFHRYTKQTCLRMLNRRSQRRSITPEAFERIWRIHVKEPHLTKDIWTRVPMLA